MSEMDFRYEVISSLRDITLNNSCVVVADESLPQSILSHFSNAILVEAGEKVKRFAALEVLAEDILSRRSTRPLTLVAVGGGSIGDAIGFLASILWRGVDLWHIPTSLLAMVDSAHGGKTAINLGSVKNQLGTFHPASRTIIVSELLDTMPLHVRRDGLSELLKALWVGKADCARTLSLQDIETFSTAPIGEISPRLQELLTLAIDVKREIVRQDPREERAIRTVLNLGHSVGHALELTHAVSHGEAVAWGLACAVEVSKEFGLTDETATLLGQQLFPLLKPFPQGFDRAGVTEALAHDKKRRDGKLQSVVLQDLGRPIITETIQSEDWLNAFDRVAQQFHSTLLRATLTRNSRRVMLTFEASKSELNRAFIIAVQRYGKTTIIGKSNADDVKRMIQALQSLGYPLRESLDGWTVTYDREEDFLSTLNSDRTLYCGDGGTTFHFLLALACTNQKETTLRVSASLMRRPHDPLIHALGKAGATITRFHDRSGQGFRVRGWTTPPTAFFVESSQSSQFASAIALLSVGSDTPFTLRLTGNVVSTAYFEMTLAMIEQAGVGCIRGNDLIAFDPSGGVKKPCTYRIAADASSRAVWEVARFLEHPLLLPPMVSSLQPDATIVALLDQIRDGQQKTEITLDCASIPDLVPVLVVAAFRSSRPVRFNHVAHLRFKESNRLEDFISSLQQLHIDVRIEGDDLVIPSGASRGIVDAVFETHADHRLVMAGFLLSMYTGSVTLTHPWHVTKSYPHFWNDARQAGWTLHPFTEANANETLR